LDRTWSDDDEANSLFLPHHERRWQPPTTTSLSASQDQPAQIAFSSSEPQLQASAKRKEREEVNPVGEREYNDKVYSYKNIKTIARIYKSILLAVSYPTLMPNTC
jgi:hypothetical protein